MKNNYKNLSSDELYEQIFVENIITKQNKDRLFKLAKADNNIEIIKKMANELDFKSAKSYLQKKENLSIESAIKTKDVKAFKMFVDNGVDIPKIKVADLIDKRYDDEFIKVFIEKGFYVNIAQLVKNNYKLETIEFALHNGASIDEIFENFTGLAYASQMGRVNVIEMLLKFSPDIEKKYLKGMTALWLAVASGHNKIIKLLLDKKANIEAKLSHGFTPLIQVASDGNLETVKLLLEHNANIEAQSAKKGTPLILAVVQDNYEVAKLLLEKGANPNIIEITGATALDCARSEKFIDLLLSYNAKSGTEIQDDIPPLIQAVIDENPDLIQILIQNSSYIDIEYNQTMTPLIQASAQGSINIVNLLLDNGANINHRTKLGITPLISATHTEQVEVIKTLLQRGADIVIKGEHSLTALDIATSVKPNAEIKKLLENNSTASKKKTYLEEMMNERVQNDFKELALQKLIELGDEDKVKTFFDSLSQDDLQKEIGKLKKDSTSFIQKSLKRKTLLNEQMASEIIIKSVGQYDGGLIHENLQGVLFSSIGTNIGYFLDFPLNTTIDPFSNEKLPYGVDWSSNIGKTFNIDSNLIFIYYSEHVFLHFDYKDNFESRNLYELNDGRLDLIQKFESTFVYDKADLYGAFFDTAKDGYSDYLEKFYIDNCQYLDLDKIYSNGSTILMSYCWRGQLDVVQALIHWGAHINIQNREGDTALMLATSGEHYEICKLLVESEADLSIKNHRGQDCGILAARTMNPEIIMLFEEKGIDIQSPIAYKVTDTEEIDAQVISEKIVEALNDTALISKFLIYALNINYDYEMDLDEYIKDHNGYLVSFRPGREYNFDKMVVETYDKLHNTYLDSINVSDENKDNIRTRIYDILMEKYQLGKYEKTRFEDLKGENQIKPLKTLKIIDNNLKGEVEIFDDHIVLKVLNDERKTLSTTYEKISENKYSHKNKGEIVITRQKIYRADLQGNQDMFKYEEKNDEFQKNYEGHNPKLLSEILRNFSKDKLKYTNHNWDQSSLTYERFMKNVDSGWNEIDEKLKALTKDEDGNSILHSNIQKFLYNEQLGEKDSNEKFISWGDKITIGWSSKEIKKCGNKPHLYEIENDDRYNNFKKVMNYFKSLFVIKQDNKDLKLLKKFTKLRKEYKYDFKLDLEQIKTADHENIFTDVERLELALSTILSEINDRVDRGNEVKVNISEDKNNNTMILKIIHIGSTSKSNVGTLEKSIEKSGFEGIYNNLKSVCDWSIETFCSDGKRYKIDYLYPEIDNDKPHSYPIDDEIEGFTHILRFYI